LGRTGGRFRIAGEETINGRACWVITTPLRESDGTAVTMKKLVRQRALCARAVGKHTRREARADGVFGFSQRARGLCDSLRDARRAASDVQIVNAQIVSVASGERYQQLAV
jgi:hypothetical protein